MSAQTMADAFAPVEARYHAQIQEETFGHLAPTKNKTYKGRIVYTAGVYGSGSLNPTVLVSNLVPSSPWYYNAEQDFIREHKPNEGVVYEFKGTFRNYVFKGTITKLFDANKEKPMSALTKEEILKEYGSLEAYYGPRPTKCECQGHGLIPPHVKPGENQVRCPYHRPFNESWPQLQEDGTVEFIPTVKGGKRIL